MSQAKRLSFGGLAAIVAVMIALYVRVGGQVHTDKALFEAGLSFVESVIGEFQLEHGRLPRDLAEIRPMFELTSMYGRPLPDWSYTWTVSKSGPSRKVILRAHAPGANDLKTSWEEVDSDPEMSWTVRYFLPDLQGRDRPFSAEWNISHLLAKLVYDYHQRLGRWPSRKDLVSEDDYWYFANSPFATSLHFTIDRRSGAIFILSDIKHVRRRYSEYGPDIDAPVLVSPVEQVGRGKSSRSK
jgi:hypothetical protein